MKPTLLILALCCILYGCTDSNDTEPTPTTNKLYFPPLTGTTWETTTPESLGWNTTALTDLYAHLDLNNTRAFIVLKDGKIVLERYAGLSIAGTTPFNSGSQWYWASAGKSLAATVAGVAIQDGLLDLNAPVSRYLGTGWTSAPLDKENLITVRNQLTMTTGLDYTQGNLDCTTPACLQYRRDAGTQWFYHNGSYTLIHNVTAQATGTDYNSYTSTAVSSKIGMTGQWRTIGDNEVYWSTPRDAARFGLLALAKGNWDGNVVLNESFFNDATSTSQTINPSYGYLWWLNGKGSVLFPTLTTPVPTDITPTAPDDMFSALGKNGQIIDVIPSENLVLIRMGDAPDNGAIPIVYHNEIWELLNAVLGR